MTQNLFFRKISFFLASLILTSLLFSCKNKNGEHKEEQISAEFSDITEPSSSDDSTWNSVQGNMSMTQIPTTPNAVIQTGMPQHRLVTVYKGLVEKKEGENIYYRGSNDYGGYESETQEHYMPGIDILYGYNLLNIAHYDLKLEKMNFLFQRPALIKTLYYPSFSPDSINKKPVNRNFYLVSVYDEDTNKDTLINRKDLRRFYLFDSTGTVKTQLIPSDYSIVRSQYDQMNDVMYLFATHDVDKNGKKDKKEPMHIFWIDLKAPAKAKRLY